MCNKLRLRLRLLHICSCSCGGLARYAHKIARFAHKMARFARLLQLNILFVLTRPLSDVQTAYILTLRRKVMKNGAANGL